MGDTKYSQTALPIHPYAGLVPLATELDQISLTDSINRYGQQEPIILWKGQIVDGRCRQKALLALARPIAYKELDNELSDRDVRIWVQANNTRRQLTVTQKATIAARLIIDPLGKRKPTIAELCIAWGVKASLLKNTIWIGKNHPNTFQNLFDGLSVQIKDGKGNIYWSNKITAIYAYFKTNEESTKEVITYGWVEGSSIRTQAAKTWYKSKMEGRVLDLETKIDYEELANLKFPPSLTTKQEII